MIFSCGVRQNNTYAYPIRDGFVMVDTGSPSSFKAIKARLERNDISFNNIRYIFLTHAHADHAGCLKEILIKYPHIRVICHRDAINALVAGQNSFYGYCTSLKAYIYCKILGKIGMKNHTFPKIDSFLLERFIFVDEGNYEEIGRLINGEIILTPGHTSDSISLFTNNYLFCGDMAMNGIWSHKKVIIWIEDRIKLISSWNRVIALNPKLVYPGHGKPFKIAELSKNIEEIKRVKMYKLR